MGVFSSISLPRGVRFGPYQGIQINEINSNYCWQIYDNNKRPIHVIDAMDANRSNWMRYVNCARHWCEQNLIAYQYRGQIYYRTIKTIPKYTELLVFYGSEFANLHNINLKKYNEEVCYTDVIYAYNQASENDFKSIAPQTIQNEIIREDHFLNDNDTLKTSEKTVSTYFPNNKSDACDDLFSPSGNFWGTSSPKIEETTPFSVLNENSPVNSTSNLTSNNESLHDFANSTSPNANKNKTIVFCCDLCEKQFKHKRSIRRHKISHLKVENTLNIANVTEPCQNNNLIISKNQYLMNRNSTSLPVKRFQCNLCEFQTTRRYTLTDHMGRHTKEIVYNCPICLFYTYSKIAIRRHRRWHNAGLRFV